MSAACIRLFNDPASLAEPQTLRQDRPDGSFVLRHPEPLQAHARCVGEWLAHWAATTPDALFLAERDGPNAWRRLSYTQTRSSVGRIAQGLLDLRLPAGRPVVVLSDNAIDHALLMLACLHIGRAVCTVSSAYSRLAGDHSKLHAMLDALGPCMVYASHASVYGKAAQSWPGQALRVFSQGSDEIPDAIAFSQLLDTQETAAVHHAALTVQPGDHAKYLLTSGSTGLPKVVINTHRMLTANQQQMCQVWPFLTRHKLHLLEWLPWSHTFGGNHNFNMVLAHGGSLTIDDGRPAPGLIDKTVRNLREVKPNFFFNVPRGFDMLLPFLEQDPSFAEAFFSRLEGMFYAGAALPQSLWQRLEAVAANTPRPSPHPVWFTSSWGATETSPALTAVHWQIGQAGCIGGPVPGVELKLVPNAGKLEMRVRGPNVFPGYLGAPELSAQAFDSEGFYLIGDAGKLVDESDPSRGVAFDGRVAEDFKLASGTWVSVGMLRTRVVTALSPLAADVVVTGHDRDAIGVLVFLTPAARDLAPKALFAQLRAALAELKAESGGSSHAPSRARILAEPPSIDAGEITDKGYVNQRAVLRRRAAEVAALYDGTAGTITV